MKIRRVINYNEWNRLLIGKKNNEIISEIKFNEPESINNSLRSLLTKQPRKTRNNVSKKKSTWVIITN